jgi:hypothetical protein
MPIFSLPETGSTYHPSFGSILKQHVCSYPRRHDERVGSQQYGVKTAPYMATELVSGACRAFSPLPIREYTRRDPLVEKKCIRRH